MIIRKIDSTNFQAKFRFSNTKQTPPTLGNILITKAIHPCTSAIKCGIKGIMVIGLLSPIITKIMQIKNSIKEPT